VNGYCSRSWLGNAICCISNFIIKSYSSLSIPDGEVWTFNGIEYTAIDSSEIESDTAKVSFSISNNADSGGDQPMLKVVNMDFGLHEADITDSQTDDGDEDPSLTKGQIEDDTNDIKIGTFRLENVDSPDLNALTLRLFDIDGTSPEINNSMALSPIRTDGSFDVYLLNSADNDVINRIGADGKLELALYVIYDLGDDATAPDYMNNYTDPFGFIYPDGAQPTSNSNELVVTQVFDVVDTDIVDGGGNNDLFVDEIYEFGPDDIDPNGGFDPAVKLNNDNVSIGSISNIIFLESDGSPVDTDLQVLSNLFQVLGGDVHFNKVELVQNDYLNLSKGEEITLNFDYTTTDGDTGTATIKMKGQNQDVLINDLQSSVDYNGSATIDDQFVIGEYLFDDNTAYPSVDRADSLDIQISLENVPPITGLDHTHFSIEQNPNGSYYLKLTDIGQGIIDYYINNVLAEGDTKEISITITANDYIDSNNDGVFNTNDDIDVGDNNSVSQTVKLNLTGKFVDTSAPEIVDFGDNPNTTDQVENELVIDYGSDFDGNIDIDMEVNDADSVDDNAHFATAGNHSFVVTGNFPIGIDDYQIHATHLQDSLQLVEENGELRVIVDPDSDVTDKINQLIQNLDINESLSFEVELSVTDTQGNTATSTKTITLNGPTDESDLNPPEVYDVIDAVDYNYSSEFDDEDLLVIDDQISITDPDGGDLSYQILPKDGSDTDEFSFTLSNGQTITYQHLIDEMQVIIDGENSSISWTEDGLDLVESIVQDMGLNESINLQFHIQATDPQGLVSALNIQNDFEINLNGPTLGDLETPEIYDLGSTMGGDFNVDELDINDRILMFRVENTPNISAANISLQAMAVEDTGDGSSDTYFYYNMDSNGQTSAIPGEAFTVEKITQGQWDGWFTVQLTQQAIDHMKDQGLTENEIMELRFTVNAHHPEDFSVFGTANTYTGYLDHVKIHGADMPQATVAQSVDDPDIDDPDQDDAQDPAQQAQQSSGNSPVTPTSSTIIDILQPLEFYSESELDTDFMLTSFEVMDGSDPVDLDNIQVVINTMEIGNSTNQADFTFGFNSDDPSIDNYLNVEFNQNTGAYEVYFMQEAIDMIADSLDEGEYMRSHVEIQAVDSNGDTVVETSQVGFYVEGEDDASAIDTSDDPDSGNGNNGGQLSNLMTMEYLIDQGNSADDDLGISWDDLGDDPSAKDDYFTALDMFGSTDIQLYSSVGQNGSNKLSLTGSTDDDSISVDQNSTIQIDGIDLNDDDII
jgi:hypothetical protein